MRVALVEDDLIYRSGLVRCLRAAGVDVTCAAADGAELRAHLASALHGGLLPDVAILDIRLSRAHPAEGLDLAADLATAYPQLGILLLSAHAEQHYAETFYAGGTSGRGYALKENFTDVATMRLALGRVSCGQSWTDPDLLDLLLPRARPARLADLLSPREYELLGLIAAGLTNTAIADRLRISAKSVEATATSIFRKLDIRGGRDHNPRVVAALRWHREQDPPD